jgi:hypothetical protein
MVHRALSRPLRATHGAGAAPFSERAVARIAKGRVEPFRAIAPACAPVSFPPGRAEPSRCLCANGSFFREPSGHFGASPAFEKIVKPARSVSLQRAVSAARVFARVLPWVVAGRNDRPGVAGPRDDLAAIAQAGAQPIRSHHDSPRPGDVDPAFQKRATNRDGLNLFACQSDLINEYGKTTP